MSIIPADLKYTKSHEWFKIENGIATVGVTDFAQHQLTDIVYIDMPVKGIKGKVGDTLLTIESVKSAEDVYFPVTGEVIETDQELNDKPELVNSDPYKYWLVKIKITDEKYDAMQPEEYKKYTGE